MLSQPCSKSAQIFAEILRDGEGVIRHLAGRIGIDGPLGSPEGTAQWMWAGIKEMPMFIDIQDCQRPRLLHNRAEARWPAEAQYELTGDPLRYLAAGRERTAKRLHQGVSVLGDLAPVAAASLSEYAIDVCNWDNDMIVISSCTVKMSFVCQSRENVSAQRCAPDSVSANCAVIRSLFPAWRKLPSMR